MTALNTAIFGPAHPPPWMPFALSGVSMALTAVGVGIGPEAVGPSCMVGVASITIFGVLHYRIYQPLNVVRDQPAQVERKPEPATPTAPGFVPYHQTAERMVLVDPDFSGLMDEWQAQQLAIGIIRKTALTDRNWNPSVFSRPQRERVWNWMVDNQLVDYVGNSSQIERTERGRAWARDVTRLYPTPFVRTHGRKAR